MRRRSRKGLSLSAAMLSVSLAVFSCSYGDDEDDDDEKDKNDRKVEAVRPQRLIVRPSDPLAGGTAVVGELAMGAARAAAMSVGCAVQPHRGGSPEEAVCPWPPHEAS